MPELIELPWRDGKSIHDLFPEATFYESIQEGWEAKLPSGCAALGAYIRRAMPGLRVRRFCFLSWGAAQMLCDFNG